MACEFSFLPTLCLAGAFLTSASRAQEFSKKPAETTALREGFTIPKAWTRRGVVLERQKDAKDSSVSGDPCIVWDEAIKAWRMVLFHWPPGHAQAIC